AAFSATTCLDGLAPLTQQVWPLPTLPVPALASGVSEPQPCYRATGVGRLEFLSNRAGLDVLEVDLTSHAELDVDVMNEMVGAVGDRQSVLGNPCGDLVGVLTQACPPLALFAALAFHSLSPDLPEGDDEGTDGADRAKPGRQVTGSFDNREGLAHRFLLRFVDASRRAVSPIVDRPPLLA